MARMRVTRRANGGLFPEETGGQVRNPGLVKPPCRQASANA